MPDKNVSTSPRASGHQLGSRCIIPSPCKVEAVLFVRNLFRDRPVVITASPTCTPTLHHAPDLLDLWYVWVDQIRILCRKEELVDVALASPGPLIIDDDLVGQTFQREHLVPEDGGDGNQARLVGRFFRVVVFQLACPNPGGARHLKHEPTLNGLDDECPMREELAGVVDGDGDVDWHAVDWMIGSNVGDGHLGCGFGVVDWLVVGRNADRIARSGIVDLGFGCFGCFGCFGGFGNFGALRDFRTLRHLGALGDFGNLEGVGNLVGLGNLGRFH